MEKGTTHSTHRNHDTASGPVNNNSRTIAVEKPYVEETNWSDGKKLRLMGLLAANGNDREILQFAPKVLQFRRVVKAPPPTARGLDIKINEMRNSVMEKLDVISGAIGVLLGIKKPEEMEGDIYNYFVVTGSGSTIVQRFDPPLQIEDESELALVNVSIGQVPLNVTENILVKKALSSGYGDYQLPPAFYGTVNDLAKGLEVVAGLTYSPTENTLTGATVLLPLGIAYALGYTDKNNNVLSAFSAIATSLTVDSVKYIRVGFNKSRLPNEGTYRVLGFFGNANFEVLYVHLDVCDHIMVGAKPAKVVQIIPFNPVNKFKTEIANPPFTRVMTREISRIEMKLKTETASITFAPKGSNSFLFTVQDVE